MRCASFCFPLADKTPHPFVASYSAFHSDLLAPFPLAPASSLPGRLSFGIFLPLPPSFWPASLQLRDTMWWWLLGVSGCLLLVAVAVFFLATGQRHKVFSEKSLRPPGPLVTDSRQRDERLKKGEKDPSDPNVLQEYRTYTVFVYFCTLFISGL